ncbi:MAG: D-alanyl-D-alanine carboxypeptidase [Thermaerobacter sp.]|nr:D-alanyl-D-alanine carboxypeptidase [Thermaerobacter sp.]
MHAGLIRTLAAVLLLCVIALPAQGAEAASSLPSVKGIGYELIDATTGQVLLAHNQNVRLAPASTTKIMTALLTVMHGDLQRTVTVSPQAYGVEGSSAYLVPGQKLTIRNLLYGLLLVSGNDAAVELAIAEAGSVPRFVAQMNAEAKKLGATNTTFLNPDGLYLPGHLTTAHDLALFTRAAFTYPAFRQIDAAKSFRFPGDPKPYTMYNQNLELWRYPGAVGGKIGYTVQAKQSIVTVATRGGVTLIAVVLHSDFYHMWTDPQNLLNWGFAHYRQVGVVQRGDVFGHAADGARAVATAGYSWLVGPGQTLPAIQATVHWPAVWRKGQPVGQVLVRLAADDLATIPLVASGPSPAPKKSSHFLLSTIAAVFAVGFVSVLWRWRSRRRRRVRYRFKRRI